MRMTLVTIGSRGDVEPIIALGSALRRAGHQVRVATSPEFEAAVHGVGLDFAPVGPHAADVLGDVEGRRLILASRGVGGQALQLRRMLNPLIEQLAGDALAATGDAEGVLYTPLANLGQVIEELGIPAMMLSLWPKSRTTAFPAVGFPQTRFLGGSGYNLLTHILLEQLSWRPFQREGNRVRAALGLPPLRRETPLGRKHRQRRPVLYGFSESVVPRPPDWGPWVHVSGYWFPALRQDWQPPGELVDFLEAGEPPVVVTFGSMSVSDPVGLGQTVTEALRLTGRRGLLVGKVEPVTLGDQLLHLQDVPYHWLFPRAATVVHHGGAGTTAAALRAGVPSVVVPFFADQPFWAGRTAELAAGTSPVPLRRLTPPRLAAAIEHASGDPRIRCGAARLSEKLRAEDGLGRAVDVIEQRLTAERALNASSQVCYLRSSD